MFHTSRLAFLIFVKYGYLFKCIILGALVLFCGLARAAEPVKELAILSWYEYIMPEMVDSFEKQYHAKVKITYYESDDKRDQLLSQTEGKGFDLILTNGIMIDEYRKQGWIRPIPSVDIANLVHIESRWRKGFVSSYEYGVPYFWGTFGIAYRKDLVSEPITSWKQLFEPKEELQGKILQVNSSRDILGMALKSLGYSANSDDPAAIKEIEKLLLMQKEFVKDYGYIALSEESSLVKGEIIAATVYGGDAVNVAQHNANIVYVLPDEGGNIWVDYFSFSAKSKQPTLAASFINFINQPKWAAKNAEHLYLATANKSAEKYLSANILNDPVIYPSAEKMSRSEMYTKLSPRALRSRAMVFTRIVK